MASEISSTAQPGARRKALQISLAYLMAEAGLQAAEDSVMETLTEMLQSFLTSLGYTGRSYCELAGRSEPILGDVVLALVNLGFNLDGLEAYSRRGKKPVMGPLQVAQTTKPPALLHTGLKKNFPSHIFDYLPSFPDSHAYINTVTHKQPATEYETIREKAAIQKRDVEKALTKYVARTCPTQSFFMNEDSAFPLIACKPLENPNASALLPRDQVFEEEEEEEVPMVTERKRVEGVRNENEESLDIDLKDSDARLIDNPFLRSAKLPPKLMKKK